MFKRAKTRHISQCVARTILLLSLVMAAFAHTVAAPQLSTPSGYDARAYVAQFTLPDGSLPIICDRTGRNGSHHSGTMPCEFCSLADNAAFLPHPSEKFVRLCAVGLDNQPAYKSSFIAKASLGMHGASRAPPSV